jgi:hypothetical protein
MKIIVSSKSLAACLNKLDLESNHIERIVANGDELTFINRLQSEDLSCVISFFQPMLRQIDTRWDWVKKLVNQVDEQPIVLNISENDVQVIFTY